MINKLGISIFVAVAICSNFAHGDDRQVLDQVTTLEKNIAGYADTIKSTENSKKEHALMYYESALEIKISDQKRLIAILNSYLNPVQTSGEIDKATGLTQEILTEDSQRDGQMRLISTDQWFDGRRGGDIKIYHSVLKRETTDLDALLEKYKEKLKDRADSSKPLTPQQLAALQMRIKSVTEQTTLTSRGQGNSKAVAEARERGRKWGADGQSYPVDRSVPGNQLYLEPQPEKVEAPQE